MKGLLLAALLLSPAAAASAEDLLMGSVVKSDKWKMDRAKDREVFDGNVSFRNPHYTLKADHALYAHPARTWNVSGSVYTLRLFDDRSQVEVNCDRAIYEETQERAFLERGELPVRMKYTAPDGRALYGTSDRARALNAESRVYFDGNMKLSTEDLDIYSAQGLYDARDATFLVYGSTPLAVGRREGYDFAVNSDSMKLFRDSRNVKFYDRVKGWVKDVTAPAPAAAPKKQKPAKPAKHKHGPL